MNGRALAGNKSQLYNNLCYVLALREQHTLLCFVKKVLERMTPYTFVSHTKMSIVLGTSRSTNCIACAK